MAIRLTENEYRKLKNKGKNTSRRPIYACNTQPDLDEAYDFAVQTLHDIKGFISPLWDRGIVESRFVFTGTTEADYDNIIKGVHDALQGVIYKNDKQVRNTKNEYRSGI